MSFSPSPRPIEILLVEDNEADILMTREALIDAKVMNRLHVVMNGGDALDFLFRRGAHVDAPRPDILLLDLNLPGKDGREVLAELKQDETLRMIPVVILTTSRAEEDILKAYGLHANCYISKPVNFEKFAEVVRAIESFWMCMVTLPSGCQ